MDLHGSCYIASSKELAAESMGDTGVEWVDVWDKEHVLVVGRSDSVTKGSPIIFSRVIIPESSGSTPILAACDSSLALPLSFSRASQLTFTALCSLYAFTSPHCPQNA